MHPYTQWSDGTTILIFLRFDPPSSLENALLFILPGWLLIVRKWFGLPLPLLVAIQYRSGITNIKTVQFSMVDYHSNYCTATEIRVDW